jgi:WD40 repeat protein
MISEAAGCYNEPTPRSDPMLAKFTPPDEELNPPPHSWTSVSSILPVPGASQLLISGDIASGDNIDFGIFLCDSRFEHVHTLLRQNAYVGAMAVSADGELLAVYLDNDREDKKHNGSIQLINLKTGSPPRLLATAIGQGFHLAFSQVGHLLASTGVEEDAVRFWDLDSNKECSLPKLGSQIIFVSKIGYLLGTYGNYVDLHSKNGSGCPVVSTLTLPGWDELSFDDRKNVLFSGISMNGRMLGSGYTPSKVAAFKPRDGSIVGTWILPYPESEQRIQAMAFIPGDLLMIGQADRVVLHDTTSMRIRAVLSNGGKNFRSATYLLADDTIYAWDGRKISKWRLANLRNPSLEKLKEVGRVRREHLLSPVNRPTYY